MIKKIINSTATAIYFISPIILILFILMAFFLAGMGYRNAPKEEIKIIEYILTLIWAFIYVSFVFLKKFYFIGIPAFLIVFGDLYLRFKNKNPTNQSTGLNPPPSASS